MTKEEIEAEELKIREKRIKAKRAMAWITIICIVAIFAIIFASCSMLMKDLNDTMNQDWGLDTTTSTMTPEEEADYYNQDAYMNHMAKTQQAFKTIATVAVVAVVICVAVLIIKRKKSRG